MTTDIKEFVKATRLSTYGRSRSGESEFYLTGGSAIAMKESHSRGGHPLSLSLSMNLQYLKGPNAGSREPYRHMPVAADVTVQHQILKNIDLGTKDIREWKNLEISNFCIHTKHLKVSVHASRSYFKLPALNASDRILPIVAFVAQQEMEANVTLVSNSGQLSTVDVTRNGLQLMVHGKKVVVASFGLKTLVYLFDRKYKAAEEAVEGTMLILKEQSLKLTSQGREYTAVPQMTEQTALVTMRAMHSWYAGHCVYHGKKQVIPFPEAPDGAFWRDFLPHSSNTPTVITVDADDI